MTSPQNVDKSVVTVDNMPRLRAIISLSGIVNVKGFSSIEDGGGGNFIWDPASLAEDNNGTIIIPRGRLPSIAGRWIRQFFEEINVRWFGAVGDGFANDTDAVQDAWNATYDATNKRVYRLIFPSGTYNVNSLTSGSMPSAYLEGIGKVIITSPNSLGDPKEVNQIIKFTSSCGSAYITNMIFQGISTPDAGIVQYSDGKVLSCGTDPPLITITGTANQCVILKIIATLGGDLGSWQFNYSTDNGITFLKNITSATTVPIKSSVDLSATGLTLHIDPGEASSNNIWIADISATHPSFYLAGRAADASFNHRVGIYYQGTDAIICKNVEVSNMPYAGLYIDNGVGQTLIENSYFYQTIIS